MIEEQLHNLIAAQQEANRLLAFIAKNFGDKPKEPVFETKVEKPKIETKEVNKVEDAKPIPTLQECRELLVKVSKKLKREGALKLLGRFNIEKLPDLKEEDYEAFYNAATLSLEEA